MIRRLTTTLANIILGARCPYCKYRVFPKDRCAHRYACAGDRGVRR